MNLFEAQTLARTAMRAHGLHDWTFTFNRRKGAFGTTNFSHKTIALSSILTEHADREQVIQTVGHEIAHALAGHAAGHGPVWKAQMRAMGLRPDRCGTENVQQKVALFNSAKYVLTCSVSGKTLGTLDRIVKTRRIKPKGMFDLPKVRHYGARQCSCHRKDVLYNGKSWDDIV